MTLSADYVESTEVYYLVMLFLPLVLIPVLRLTTKYNIDTTSSHIGGNSNSIEPSCLSNDARFLLM